MTKIISTWKKITIWLHKFFIIGCDTLYVHTFKVSLFDLRGKCQSFIVEWALHGQLQFIK
jgi:hypothetical protein